MLFSSPSLIPAPAGRITKTLLAAFSAVILATLAPQANAIPLNLTLSDATGEVGYVDLYLSNPPAGSAVDFPVYAGTYGMLTAKVSKADNLNVLPAPKDIPAFCSQLVQPFSSTPNLPYSVHDIDEGPYADNVVRNIRFLFDHAYTDAVSSMQAGQAFQLAIWEILHDSDNNASGNPVDPLRQNNFSISFDQANDGGDPYPDNGTELLATSYLNFVFSQAPGAVPLTNVAFLDNDTYQDLFVATSVLVFNTAPPTVPEPATFGFGLALLGLSATARFRFKRA